MFGALVLGGSAVPVLSESSPAQAAGPVESPGPVEPTVLFLEDFENGTGGSAPTPLTGYQNAATGTKYSADPYWLDPKYCNGFITRSSLALDNNLIYNTYCGQNGDPTGGGQGDYMAVRAKAYALGQYAGLADPSRNHALSTNTSGGTPTNVMFQTTSNDILLEPDGDVYTRFIAFSVDAADTTGGEIASPQMYFYLLQDGQTPRQLNSSALPGGVGQQFNLSSQFSGFPSWARAGLVGTYYSEPFTIDAATRVGLRLDNHSLASSTGCGAYAAPGRCASGQSPQHRGSQNGNDGAIDNIRIIDVTPVLDKSFSPAIQSVGLTSTMTLTIYNRKDLERKAGWGFVDTLPENLRFANSTIGGTCTADTLEVDQSAGTLTVDGGVLPKGAESCTITTTVTSTEAGVYTNGNPNGNFTNKKYIDGPGDAQVEFLSGSVSWTKVGSDDTETPLGGSVWQLDGPNPATASTPTNGWPVGEVTDCVAASADDCTGLDTDPAEGEFTVTGLPFGEYTLTEVTAPVGYLPAVGPWAATVTLDERDVTFGDTHGKIVNTLGSAAWAKSDDAGQMLADSQWELTRDDQPGLAGESYTVEDCIGTGASDCAGMLDQDFRAGQFEVHDLPAGTYWLTETQAPTGYALLEDPLGPFTIGAGNPKIDFGVIPNYPIPGSVVWEKVDEAGDPLAGSEWEIVGPAGSGSATIPVTDNTGQSDYVGPDTDARPGYFEVEDLDRGDYTLEETRAPAGYQLISGTHDFEVTAEQPRFVFDEPFVNERRDAPVLPLTGGLGRDFFTLVGLGVLVLGGGAAATLQIRKRRLEVA